MAYRDEEAPIHKAVLGYLRAALPGAVIHHAANEIARRGKGGAIAVGIAKSLGALPGYPDLAVLWRGQFWAFEVKPEGRKATEAQLAVGAAIERNGGRWAVVRSVRDAEDCIREWRGDL